MSIEVKSLFNNIWQNYLEVTPSADNIHQLLGSGHDVINDHVAYRTFNIKKVGIDKLAQHLIALGYKECGEYHFEAKKNSMQSILSMQITRFLKFLSVNCWLKNFHLKFKKLFMNSSKA